MSIEAFLRAHLPSRDSFRLALLLFLVLCLNELGFALHGNEERYFGLALQFSDPSWVPGSFHFDDFPGTRLLFQWITGPLVKAEGFMFTAFVGRLFSFFFMSIPIAMIFKKLRFGVLEALGVLQLFLLTDQAFFAGEWIFGGYEPKVLAYIFALFAVYFFTKGKHLYTALHLVIATYFHFLVGGWSFLALSLYLLYQKEFRTLLRSAAVYLLPLIPFIIYLYSGYFYEQPDFQGMNPDHVYCYQRVPHHLGLFQSWEYFKGQHLNGVLMTGIAFVAGLLLFRKFSASGRKLAHLMLIFFGFNLLFVGVAWVDRYQLDASCSLFLKYYPFRSNSMGMFLSFILAFDLFRRGTRETSWRPLIALPLFLLFLFYTGREGIANLKRSVHFDNDHAYNEICRYISKNTEKDALFLLTDIPQWSTRYMSFIRKTERKNFFVFKFMFGSKRKVYEWYQRKSAYDQVVRGEDLEGVEALREEYGVDYVLTSKEYESEHLKGSYSNSRYTLYQVVE